MTFAFPIGAFALLALPVIVGLHLFRRRFSPRPLAGLFLWDAVPGDPSGGRRIHRVENHRSLWLQLLLALALALYLMEPRWDRARADASVVVLLDDSASMSVVDGDGSTRDRAVQCVVDLIRAADRQALITIVSSGVAPRVLAGPAASREEALSRLSTYRPEAPDHRLGSGLELARELAGVRALVHVVTDRFDGLDVVAGPYVRIHAVGRPFSDVGFVRVSRSRTENPNEDSIFIQLRNSGSTARDVTVQVRATSAVEAVRRFVLEPGADRRETIAVRGTDEDIAVHLDPDALALNDRATLVRPESRVLRYTVVDLPSEAAAAVTDALAANRNVRRSGPEELPHLLVGSQSTNLSELDREISAMVVGPFPRPIDRPGMAGPFLVDRSEVLTEWIDWNGVVLDGIGEVPPGTTPLVSATDIVLIGRLPTGAHHYLLNADLRSSNLQLLPAWPLLLGNLVEERRTRLVGPVEPNPRVGDRALVRLPTDADAVLERPGEDAFLLHPRDRLVIVEPARVGTYEIRQDGALVARLSAHFGDSAESEARDRATGVRGGDATDHTGVEMSATFADVRIHFGLVGLALLALCLETMWRRPRARRRAS